MQCYVGITHRDPIIRKNEWLDKYKHLHRWQILEEFDSKEDAQEFETETARRHGYRSGRGGRGPEFANWSVYHFYY